MPLPFGTRIYKKKINIKVQAVPRRGARYVCNRYHNRSSPTEMLNELEWEPLEARQAKIKLCMFYKIHYGPVDIFPPSYVHLAHERSHRNLRSTMALWISSHHPTSTWLMKEVAETMTRCTFHWLGLLIIISFHFTQALSYCGMDSSKQQSEHQIYWHSRLPWTPWPSRL